MSQFKNTVHEVLVAMIEEWNEQDVEDVDAFMERYEGLVHTAFHSLWHEGRQPEELTPPRFATLDREDNAVGYVSANAVGGPRPMGTPTTTLPRVEEDPPARETSPPSVVDASPSEPETTEPTTLPIPHWHVGQNIPGYSPMEPPYPHEDYENARQDLLGHLDPETLTDEWDGPDRERWEGLAKQWEEVAAEVAGLPHGTGYGAIVPLSFSDRDLGLAVWLAECSETCELPED